MSINVVGELPCVEIGQGFTGLMKIKGRKQRGRNWTQALDTALLG